MKQPLLSLCIPTYNRAQYLEKSIQSIICQDEFLNGDVEIVISDNTSTDNTKEIAEIFARKYDNFFYNRNAENVVDQNYPIVLSKAHGILRRLCNDTLVYKTDSLGYMCKVVREQMDNRPWVVWKESEQSDEVLQCNFRDYVLDMSFWITSINRYSFWEEDCLNIREDTAGTELSLWQLRKGLEIAKEKDNIFIVKRNLTDTQTVAKKNISYGLYQVFYENYFRLLEPYFNDNSLKAEDRDFLEKDLLLRFFPQWCVKWELQSGNLLYSETEDLKKLIKSQYQDKPYWKEYERICRNLLLKTKLKTAVKKLIKRG